MPPSPPSPPSPPGGGEKTQDESGTSGGGIVIIVIVAVVFACLLLALVWPDRNGKWGFQGSMHGGGGDSALASMVGAIIGGLLLQS
jgi:hypothetical protein